MVRRARPLAWARSETTMNTTPTTRCSALSLLAVVAACAAPPSVASSQPVEHVFLFVIDGVRASEGFDDPDYTQVAALVEELAPLGSLLTQMEVRGQTVTLPAHQVYVSGTFSDYGNFSPYEGRENYVPRSPTLFEAYRRHYGVPPGACWVISNTDLVGPDVTHSLMPGYGLQLRADAVFETEEVRDDLWAWQQLESVLASNEVALALINLHDVDDRAHQGEWETYLSRAELGSDEIAAFWQWLQASPVYQDRTVLMVSTDHGRHLEGVEGGWVSHGDECTGCRQAFLLALGPGIRQGYVSDDPTSLLDVAPTIASLMGIPFPYHRGRVLTELLENGESVDPGPGGLFEPTTARADDLMVRVSEVQDTALLDAEGAHQVLVELSMDGGQLWDPHTTGGAVAQYSPTAWTDGEVVVSAWLEIEVPGTSWFIRVRRLEAGEDSWDEVLYEPMLSSSTPAGNLHLVASEDRLFLVENNSLNERVRVWTSDDRGVSWSGEFSQYPVARGFPRDLQIVDLGDRWIATFAANAASAPNDPEPNDNTEIYWLVSDDEGETWDGEFPVSDDDMPSIQPAVAVDGLGVVHLVWADRAPGGFQLFHAESTDSGETFTLPVQLTFDSLGAWEPAIAVDGGRVWIAWSQIDVPNVAQIQVGLLDGDSLVDVEILSEDSRVARTPDIRPLGDCDALVSWSEGDLSGAWELRQANHETGQRSAGGVEGDLVPEVVPPTEPVELVLSLTPTLGADDLGVGAIRVQAAAGFAFDGDATLDVDGVPTEGVSLTDVETLVFTLGVPVTEDGASLDLRFTVIPPESPQSATTFQAWLEHAEAGCPAAVDDNLWIAVEEAGGDDDDDDVSSDDDSTPADDDDCSCRSDGGSRAAGIGAALLLAAAAAFGRRRRSGTHR